MWCRISSSPPQEWEDQKKSVEDLEKAITTKEEKALADQKEWKKKAEAYSEEAKKWKSETEEDRTLAKRYEKLNN